MPSYAKHIPRSIPTLSLTLALVCCGRADRSPEPTAKPLVETQATAEPVEDLRPAPVEAVESIPSPNLDKTLGNFNMTYYWVAHESKKHAARGQHPILDKKCKPIANVTRAFKKRLSLEGSGKLADGRLITTAGGCQCGAPCFWVASKSHKWGAGVAQRPLSPFRSVAVDPKEVKIGSTLYVPELDGLTMPGAGGDQEGGFVHDGCVVADDRGGGVRGKQLDFFAARRSHYRNFFKRHKITKVSVYPGGRRCEALADERDSPTPANHGSS